MSVQQLLLALLLKITLFSAVQNKAWQGAAGFRTFRYLHRYRLPATGNRSVCTRLKSGVV